MKKYLFLSMAFVATLAFVGCNDDISGGEIVNDGSKIKTKFAINIGSGSQTRMTADVVQNDAATNFRGMEKIVLASYVGQTIPTTGQLDVSAEVPASLITLGDIANGELKDTQSSKIYSNVSIPLNTNLFLFYGKAIQGDGKVAGTFADGVAKKLYYGDMTYNMSAVASPLAFDGTKYFKHNAIVAAANDFTNSEEATALVAVMNKIARVESPAGIPAIETLAMNYTGSNAGSSTAILCRVNNLLKAIKGVTAAADIAARDAIYDVFTDADVAKVFTFTAADGENPASVAYTTATYANIDKFPNYYGLPDGAALLNWNDTEKEFAYITTGMVGSTALGTATQKFVYPAELTYYVASPVKASNTAINDGDWSKTVTAWATNPATAAGTWGEKVLATSKTVAIANNINYGVARLKTSVRADDAQLSYKVPETEASANLTIGENTLPLSAVIIGGQPNALNYNYLSTDATYDNTVVDYVSGIYAKNADPDKFNYTLLFDNYKAGGQEEVNIALEFTNTSPNAMKGVDGTVYPGQKFYVLGKLDLTKVAALEWNGKITSTNAAVFFPAYGVDRVFIQDFTTTANFTLKSLENIYVTIPDLRATQLSFGLSVDLAWKAGLTFNVDID